MKYVVSMLIACLAIAPARADVTRPFVQKYCVECHDADTKKGELDLTALGEDLAKPDVMGRWVKVHDRVAEGSMPPKKKNQPTSAERSAFVADWDGRLTAAALARRDGEGRAVYRRMNREEYQNTLRDLLDLPGLDVMDLLPDDGQVRGFDKSAAALDVSHVQLAKYLEAASHALDVAIATRPEPPEVHTARIYPEQCYDFRIVLMNGDAVLMRDMKPATDLMPIIRDKAPMGLRELEQAGVYSKQSSAGVFRHEDDAFRPRFTPFAPLYPGEYRLRVSLWSYWWEKGDVKPSPLTQAAWLKAGPRLIGYFDAPSLNAKVSEVTTWMNPGEVVTFNAASLKHVRVSEKPGRAAEYIGPGIGIDWLEVEGPIIKHWPPERHRRLFGDLPIEPFDPKSAGVDAPPREKLKQTVPGAKPQPPRGKDAQAIYTVRSTDPEADARRLITSFATRAFRHPAEPAEVERYVALFRARLAQRQTFEEAMRTAYKAVLCSPDFLFLRTEGRAGPLDDYAVASRLSYFLWESMPDETLLKLAAEGKLRNNPAELMRQADRLLDDPRSDRFVEHFLSRWLNLREIDATSPDTKLYPEFSPYLRDSMVAETRAYFREMLRKDLPITDVVAGDFTFANAPLAKLYGLDPLDGSQLKRVPLPPASHRGGFLTQASVLKVTANGTVTSPVKRGAWVLDKVLNTPPDPPPAAVAAIDPDVRGTTTIRDQLDKHRSDPSCAACHAKIDPPGFALESFDVIGGWRTRYRSVGEGEVVKVDDKVQPYKLALPVDCSGKTAGGEAFADVDGFRALLAKRPEKLARGLCERLIAYATGAEVDFADRKTVNAIVERNGKAGYGVRDLIRQVVANDAFLQK